MGTVPVNPNEKTGPEYHYIPGQGDTLAPAPAEGQFPIASVEDTIIINGFIDSMVDLFSDMQKLSPFETNNPQLPTPKLTWTGVKREMNQREVKKTTETQRLISSQAIAAEATAGEVAPAVITPNPWITDTNSIAAVAIVMMMVAKNLSQAKFTDNQMKQVMNTALFELGMEAAELARTLKDMEADKEMQRAMSSFMTAGIAVYQMTSIISERAKTPGEYEDAVTAQQQKVNEAETAKTNNDTPETKKTLKIEKTKLQKLQEDQHGWIREQDMRKGQSQDAKFRAINSFSEGISSLMSSFITKQQGAVEKQKGQLETFQQMFSRWLDTVNKDKDDANSQFDRLMQMIVQYVNDTKVTISTRG